MWDHPQPSPGYLWVCALCLVLATCPPSHGYCSGLGANPGFTSAPEVSQLSLTSVRVTWQGTVTRGECADQFIVKWWREQYPNDYTFSDLLPLTQFTYVVTDLIPNQDYAFQAVAREDKGLLGKDWNKSPKAYFRTRSNNPTVSPAFWSEERSGAGHRPRQLGEAEPLGLVTWVGLVLVSLLGALVVVGVVWNIVKVSRRKSGGSESSESSDTDSMELELENTDMASRLGDSRPASRSHRSYRGGGWSRRGENSQASSRMGSPSPAPPASAPPSYSDKSSLSGEN